MGKTGSAIFGAFLLVCTVVKNVWADTVPLALPAPLPSVSASLPSLPQLQPVRFQPVRKALPAVQGHQLQAITAQQANISAFGISCDMKLNASAENDATIHVRISAPCDPNQTVVLEYEGLFADITLNMTGMADFQIPALANHNEFLVHFEQHLPERISIETPDLDEYVRVALGWGEEDAPRLSGEAPRHLPFERMTLGDGSGRVVQVISHHLDPDAQAGVIRLGMNVGVTKNNCGRTQSGSVVQTSPGLTQLRYDLKLAASSCDDVGRNLQLKNILQDLKLASN